MLARVRKIEDKEIILLNLSNFKINNCFPWTYEEVKEGMLSSKELVGVEYIEKSDRIIQKYNSLTPYTVNVIHNKLKS